MKNSELAVSKTKTVKHIKDGFSHEKYNYNGLFVFDVCSLREFQNHRNGIPFYPPTKQTLSLLTKEL